MLTATYHLVVICNILEIFVYFSMFDFILFCDICSGMTGENDTRNNNQMEGSGQH